MIRAFVFCLLLVIPFAVSFAQKDTWVEVNDGFAKCAAIGQSAGYAGWERDDFQVNNMIHLRGEVYASLEYGLNGSNTASCSGGLFRHDTLHAKWTKVAEKPLNSLQLVTNGTTLYMLDRGEVYEFTKDYSAHPTGWKKISASKLTKSSVFGSCSEGNPADGYQFQNSEAIGDTIYTVLESGKVGCWNYNQIGKFSTVSGQWTFDRFGPYPHQLMSASNIKSYKLVFADRIGGIFKYFVSYTRWGQEKCIPNYLWVWVPRSQKWENVSEGVSWKNMTGNSNPESCVNPSKPPINWGPSGGWTASWDKRDIYASSETGVYRWEGDKFYYIASYWGNAGIYPTANGIFTLPRGEILKLNPTTNVPIAELFDVACVHNTLRHFTSPDNGKTLYVVKDGMKDPQVCDWQTDKSAQLGIYRLTFDPDKPAKTRNLHVETATYVGGAGDNTPINTGVAGSHHVFVAGNFSEVKAPRPFIVKNFNGATASSRGRVIHFNTFGDTIISVTNLGNQIDDYEVQNFGQYRMVVGGDFGVSVLDSTGMNQLWNVPPSSLWGSGEINVDIDDNGHVVVLRSKQFKVFNANGVSLSGLVTLTDNYVNDITIKRDSVYVTGFNNGTLDGITCDLADPFNGLPVQSAFIKAYALVAGNLSFIFKTFGFAGSELGKDEADTRGYRINVGKDGKLYFLGEAAGGNSVFRWNGKETIANNGCTNPPTKLVTFDNFNTPFNTKSAHIAFFCTVNPRTGEVERGQYIIPRLSSGVSNSYRIKDGYIHADQKGYVYIGGASAAQFADRDVQHLNGILVDKYAGGDMVVLIVNPDYSIRTFWGTFSDELGTGVIRGFGIRDNIISTIGETSKGKMITGGTINGNFQKSNALNPEPFNLDMTDTNPLNDSYLAVWYQDVWRQAPKDTLEERKIDSNPVIDEEAANYRANFEATFTTACVGGSITFTNTSVGDSTNWVWNFGEGASLSPNTFGKGPFTVSYSTPGLKTVKLNVLLKTNVSDYEQKYNYINVLPADQALAAIQGPDLLCSGTKAIYRVDPVFGVDEYTWTVPAGVTILQGQGSASIEVAWGSAAGTISVAAKTPCGNTAPQQKSVNVIPITEKTVILVVGDETLSASDQSIKNRVETLGYSVLPIADEKINEAHGSCAAMIIISASSDPLLINYQLLNATVPIISYLGSLFDELGLTNGTTDVHLGTQLNQTQLNMVDNTHELGKGLTTGDVTVYTNPHSVNWGKPATAGIVIATIKGTPEKISIVGYEQGTALFGLTSPARRVGFYMSNEGVLDLTTDGIKLLEQAICWATYSCPTDVTVETLALTTSSYCPGSEINVPFTATGTFDTRNIFTAQLSNRDGNFTAPIVIGTLAGTTSGVIVGKIPTNVLAGTNYKVRVVSSSPSFKGIISSTTIFIQARPSNPSMISGNALACSGSTVQSYTVDEVPGATSYTWDIPLGTSMAGFPNQTTVTTISRTVTIDFGTGTSNSILVYANNACGKSEEPARLLVEITGKPPAKPAAMVGNTVVCPNTQDEVYSVSPVAFASSYSWTLSSGLTGTSATNSIEVDFNGTGTVTLSVKAIGACGESEAQSLTVTINPDCNLADADFSSTTTVCTNTPVTFTDASVGATSWTWNFGDGAVPASISGFGAAKTPPSVIYTTPGLKTVTLIINEGTSFENKETKVEYITVSPKPLLPSIIQSSGNAIACGNSSTVNFSISAVQYADADKYLWKLPTGATGSSTTTIIDVDFTAAASGYVSVAGVNQCGPGPQSSYYVQLNSLTENPKPIVGPIEVCANAMGITYEIPVVKDATSYIWQMSSGVTGTSTTHVISLDFTSAGVKSISVKASNGCTESAAATIDVTVLPGSAILNTSIAGPELICAGTTQVSYSIPPVVGATTYNWVLPSGASGSSTTNTIAVNFANPLTGKISVSAVLTCGASSSVELPITVEEGNSTPPDILGPAAVCPSQTGVVYEVTPDTNEYRWTLPEGATGSSTSNAITVDFGTTLAGSLSVSGVYACGVGAPATLAIALLESTPLLGNISGKGRLCPQAANESYTVEPLEGVTQYIWTLPQGAVGTSTSSIINIDFSAAQSGDLSVKGVTGCGFTTVSTLPIVIANGDNSKAKLVGETIICPNTTQVRYAVEGISNVLNYTWALPLHAVGSSTGSFILIDFGALIQSSKIDVMVTMECGAPILLSLPITVPEPIGSPSFIDGNNFVCKESQTDYRIEPIKNAIEYRWTLPVGATASGATNSNTITLRVKRELSGDLCVRAMGTCGEGEPVCLPITLNTDPKGECEVFVPNAFSPNNDGSNEVWQISGLKNYTNISVKVFNRWGSLVYDKTSYDSPWDGTVSGKKLASGTYYYIIVLDDEEPRKGSLSILYDNN
jgi:gliding motility-associated-like protein